MPKLTIILLGMVLVLGFQNCGNNMSFQQDGALVAKSDVDTDGDGIPDDTTSDDPTNTDDGVDGGLNPGDGSPPGATPAPSPTPRPSASPSPTPRPGTNPPYTMPTPRPGYGGGGSDDKDCGNKDKDYDHDSSPSVAMYVCILEGPGKSVKLGMRSNGLAGGNSADQAVCMSKEACLNIASKAFSVKMAESRGFCKQSSASGRVSLSNAQVEEAVTKTKLQQLLQEY